MSNLSSIDMNIETPIHLSAEANTILYISKWAKAQSY